MGTTRKSYRLGGRTTAIALAAVAAMGASLLAGCSSDSNDTSPGSSASGGKGKTTLTVGDFGVFGYKQAGLFAEYEKAHPNIKITENVITDNNTYYPQLLTHLSQSSGLNDIQAIEVGNINEVTTKLADKFEDVSKAPGVDKNNFLGWKWAQATNTSGKTIGLGTDIGPMAMCYRPDLFKAAGLPTDPAEVSALWAGDWQKYINAGKTYAKKAKSGTSFMDSASGLYNAVIASSAESYYDSSGKVVYDTNPVVKNAWNLAMAAASNKLSAKLTQFQPPWNQAFANGKFATVSCPPWMLGYIKEKAGTAGENKWNVASSPKPGNWGGAFIGVPSAGKNKAEALKLAAWLTAPEQQAKVFAVQGSFPSSSAAYDLPEVKDAKHAYFNNAPIGTIFTAAAKESPTQIIGPKSQQIGTAITNTGVTQVDQQGKSPATGWKAAVKEIDNVLGQ